MLVNIFSSYNTIMLYLKYECACSITYKTRRSAECFVHDKTRPTSVLSRLKNNSV